MILTILTKEHATQKYIDWLNNPEINKYLESRFVKHTIESVKEYIQQCIDNLEINLYGIFVDDEHVGNIKMHINRHHNYADIGYIIGREYWGKGYATQAIKMICDIGFNSYKLNKIWAGVYSNNIGSIKALDKNDFIQEGYLEKHYLCNGEYVDCVLMGRLK